MMGSDASLAPNKAKRLTTGDPEESKPVVRFKITKKPLRAGLKNWKNPLVDDEPQSALTSDKATKSALMVEGDSKMSMSLRSKPLLGKRKHAEIGAETEDVHRKDPCFLKIGSLVEVLTKPFCGWAPARIVDLSNNAEIVEVTFFNDKCRGKKFRTSKFNLRDFKPYEHNPHRFIGHPCRKVEVSTPVGWMLGRLLNWDPETGVVKVDFFWRKAEYLCSISLLRSHERPLPTVLLVNENVVYERWLRSLHLYTPVMAIQVFTHTAEVFPLCPLLDKPSCAIVSLRDLRPVRASVGDLQRVGYQSQEKVEIKYKNEIWDGRVISWDSNTDLVTVTFDWDQRVETFSSYLVRPARQQRFTFIQHTENQSVVS